MERTESSLSLSLDTRPLPPSTTFDLPAFRLYLSQLIPLLLGAQEHEIEDMFDLPDFAEHATKWASDPSAGVVYVVKTREERDEGEEGTFGCCFGKS